LFALVVCNLGVRGVHGNSIFGRLLETLRASPYFGPVQGPPASTSRCASNLTSRRTAPFAVWCDDVGALRLLDRRPSGPWWLPRCGRHAVYVRRLAVLCAASRRLCAASRRLCAASRRLLCGVSPTFVRRLADFVRRLADFVRRLADFVRRLADFVRRLADFVRRLADFVRRLADFQNHAGPRLTLLRLRGGVQGRRPRLRL